ncbi:MAG: ferrous iron transport protein A [Acidobacteria bacterium]|nr:ferrous iron transport protein A [Acidobacteriota bacterium]
MGLNPELTRTRLTDLGPGQSGTIDEIFLPPEAQQFLTRFGLYPGMEIRFSRSAPMGDPRTYLVDGAEIALRSETAQQIFVIQSHPEDAP